MSFESVMRDAAHKAADITDLVMGDLGAGLIKHEDDLSGAFAGAFRQGFRDLRTQGIHWNAAVLTHRRSGEEGTYGADLLIHVKLDTPEQSYSKGVLVQSKRIGPRQNMSGKHHKDLKEQCEKMMGYTAESFVFAYDPAGMRCGSANRIAGATDRDVYDQCSWTPYRFFLEFFRCPAGDKNITSALVEDLRPRAALEITAKGTFKPVRRRVRLG
ncbi:hypothetical protein NL532_10160 [Mesorhizobium sp. C120A]|uniref:hypothetical protein n=1 Tax=unclassified Mesorhizobium TaxID=325217 RepID=UPI0003D01E6B|nr:MULTISPECIES: hypothetical protein [unclassified Mesorhizobium]ESZ66637.1 hypothetical protein X728_04050 [Mesorhizobium sp. L103C120A0]WJI46958.1 hypothetical protein NL532_10160 [Mesorhizobium sp. C120A]